MSVANMIIEIYVAESALLRTEKLHEHLGSDKVKGQEAMTRLCLYNAVETAGRNGREAISAFAEGDDRQLLMMGLKRFTKPMNYNVKELRRSIAAQVIDAGGYCF